MFYKATSKNKNQFFVFQESWQSCLCSSVLWILCLICQFLKAIEMYSIFSIVGNVYLFMAQGTLK